MTAQEEDNLGLHQSSQPCLPTHVEQPLPTANLQPQDERSTFCTFSLCRKAEWQKGNLANDRPLAKMREKIWENGRKTKCRTNYPINVQLSPCGLMVCVGFGNSSTRLRSLLNSLWSVVGRRQTQTLSQWRGLIAGCYNYSSCLNYIWLNTKHVHTILHFKLRHAEFKSEEKKKIKPPWHKIQQSISLRFSLSAIAEFANKC